jgi:hypothetical protein
LAAPRPSTDTEIDLRTAAQRDADALVELAARALSEGQFPTEGGERPQVVVTVSLPVLQGRIGSAQLALGGPNPPVMANSCAHPPTIGIKGNLALLLAG